MRNLINEKGNWLCLELLWNDHSFWFKNKYSLKHVTKIITKLLPVLQAGFG